MYQVYQKDCPDCQACQEKVKNQKPLRTATIRTEVLVMAALLISGLSLDIGAARATVTTDWQFISQFTVLGVGVLSTLGVPLFALVEYIVSIRPRNQIGYATYPFLLRDGSMHRHLTDPRKGGWTPSDITVLIEDRVGGWHRKTSICSGRPPMLTVKSWDGEEVTLQFSDAEIKTPYYGYVLWLLRQGYTFHDTLEDLVETLPAARDQLYWSAVELYTLQIMTSHDDPMGHGRSRHGQALQEHINRFIDRKLGMSIQERMEAREHAQQILLSQAIERDRDAVS